MQLPSFCTVYHNYNWVMTREKMNDTIKQPFFEWKNILVFSLFLVLKIIILSIVRYIWDANGAEEKFIFLCFATLKWMKKCPKSTIFECLESEVQVPPPLKVIRKLATFHLSCNFFLAWYKQTKKYHTTPIHFNENAKNWIHFGLEKQLGLLL